MSREDMGLILSVLQCIVVIGVSVISFIVYRHFYFKSIIKRSKIPFVPIESYYSGSYYRILTEDETRCDRTTKYFNNFDSDYFGVFLGSRALVFTKDLDLIHKIFIKEFIKFPNRWDFGSFVPHGDKTLTAAKTDFWRKLRRSLGSTMTLSKLKMNGVDSDINDSVERMLNSLEEKLHSKISNSNKDDQDGDQERSIILDIHPMSKKFSMDVSLKFSFDEGGLIDYKIEEDEIITMAKDLTKKGSDSAVIQSAMFVPILKPIVEFIVNNIASESFFNFLIRISYRLIDKQRAEINNLSNRRMVHALLELYDAGHLKKEEVMGNSLFMLMAGYDTTGDSFIALIWQLARNQKIQEKLRDEIVREGIDSKYLECAIKEATRIHPPVVTAREIPEDLEWKGMKLIKGMHIIVPIDVIHRDKEIWGEDALEFKPERFGDTNNFHPAQFLTFGLGPRNCVGGHLAMLELKSATSALLMKYRIVTCDETPKELNWRPGKGTIFFLNIIQDPVKLKLIPLND